MNTATPRPIDSSNQFLVLRRGDGGIEINNYLPKHLSRDQALNLAAWIIALTGASREEFKRLLDGIRNT